MNKVYSSLVLVVALVVGVVVVLLLVDKVFKSSKRPFIWVLCSKDTFISRFNIVPSADELRRIAA